MIVALPFRGHVVPLARLSTELSSRGHRVTVAVQDEGKQYINANKTNVKVISLGRARVTTVQLKSKLMQICHDPSYLRSLLSLTSDIYLASSASTFKSLVAAVKRDPPNIMVIDIAAVSAVVIAQANNIPFVINNPSLMQRHDGYPDYLPAWGSGFPQSMTLLQRCLSLVYPSIISIVMTPVLTEVNKQRALLGLPIITKFEDAFKSSIVMVCVCVYGSW
jgi:UDP:flavonoid glycosyltransferase YjiC (YdhE family)